MKLYMHCHTYRVQFKRIFDGHLVKIEWNCKFRLSDISVKRIVVSFSRDKDQAGS